MRTGTSRMWLLLSLLAVLTTGISFVYGDIVKDLNLHNCPVYCICTNVRSRTTLTEATFGPSLKVKCGGGEKKLSSLQELTFPNEIAQDVQQLNLSDNKISIIKKGELSKFTQLKRLDLSRNLLSSVSFIFEGLNKLERIKLNHNQLTHIQKGVFDNLTSLKQMDISGNPWICDCKLVWLLDWALNRSIKLTSAAKCGSPAAWFGQPIRKLKTASKLNCEKQSTVPATMELQPSSSQVVFEGDTLLLHCQAPSVGNEVLVWTWDDQDAESVFKDIGITSKRSEVVGVVESWLHINYLLSDHTGHWQCHQITEQANRSQDISVIVISEKTMYCPQQVTSDSRGTYTWPRTVMGVTAELLCEGEQTGDRKAYHLCSLEGHWSTLNATACPFVSETTKILEQFAKMNLSLTKGTLLESAKRLKNFTSDGKHLRDKMDIIFIAKTIENYLNFLTQEKELGPLLVDIVSSLLYIPDDVTRAAQMEELACSRLVRALEHVVENIPSLKAHGTHIAAEEFRVKRDNFPGLTCTWYSHSGGMGRFFHCSNSNATALIGSKAKVIEASIQIPASLFHQLEGQGVQGTVLARQLTVMMYKNSKLFPTQDPSEEVTSAVVGVKLVGISATSLSQPVYVVLRAPYLNTVGTPRPVWWDDDTGWNSKGCQLSYLVDGLLVFQCNRLGYFGLIQKANQFEDVSGVLFGVKFRFCHPAVYIGGLVCVITLTSSIMVFITCYTSIKMSKKTKHSLINTWIAFDLLCFLYLVGIQQTEDIKVCQGIGLILHYLTLSSLLWMCVTISNMYKQVNKTTSLQTADDDLPSDLPVAHKPLLGLYLVGWGIGLIVCGISGAVNLRQYAGHSHCFLMTGPAISAVFVPAIILIIYLSVCFLLIRCTVRSLDSNRQLSEGTQVTENVDLELLDSRPSNLVPERTSLHSASTPTRSSVVEDTEYSSLTQLKAHVIVLVFYILTWLAGALATTTPFQDYLPYEETIFSIIYAILASCLGSFILFFYCVARSDVRKEWYLGKCWWHRKSGRCCRTRSISDTNPAPTIPVNSIATMGGATVVSSRQSVNNSLSHHTDRSSKTNKSVNAAKAAIELNHRPMKNDFSSEQNANVNLIMLHRQKCRSNNSVTTFTEPSGISSAEMFYNPHQSTVARKFFRKQRRHMRRNNPGTRRRGDGGGGDTDSNKPNSAVDLRLDCISQSSQALHLNSNSSNNRDSGDNSGIDLPLERLVIGAEESDLCVPTSVAKHNIIVACRSVENGTEDVNITFEDGEAELAQLAAEFQAIKEEVKATHLKEIEESENLYANPISSCEDNELNECSVDSCTLCDSEKKPHDGENDERNHLKFIPEKCSLLPVNTGRPTTEDFKLVCQGADLDSLESDSVEGEKVNRKHLCSSFSGSNSSQFTSSALGPKSEEFEHHGTCSETNSCNHDGAIDDERKVVINKKETSV